MGKLGVLRLTLSLSFAACAAGAGCRYDHHYPQPPPPPAPPCTGIHPERQVTLMGNPRALLDGTWYGGTSSWTHEGAPPAGDRCAWPPPGVTPRPARSAPLSQR